MSFEPVNFFFHDYNARGSQEMQCAISDHGVKGYGIYWILIEMMYEAKNSQLKIKYLEGIANYFKLDYELLKAFIKDAVEKYEIFQSDGEYIWSERVIRHKAQRNDKYADLSKMKSEAGKKGMESRWGKKDVNPFEVNDVITEDNTVITTENTIEDAITEDNATQETVLLEPTEPQQKPANSGKKQTNNYRQDILSHFQNEYYHARGKTYIISNESKELKGCSTLAKWYKERHPDHNTAQALEGLKTFFKESLSLEDKWHKPKMSPTYIASNINVLEDLVYNCKFSGETETNGNAERSDATALI